MVFPPSGRFHLDFLIQSLGSRGPEDIYPLPEVTSSHLPSYPWQIYLKVKQWQSSSWEANDSNNQLHSLSWLTNWLTDTRGGAVDLWSCFLFQIIITGSTAFSEWGLQLAKDAHEIFSGPKIMRTKVCLFLQKNTFNHSWEINLLKTKAFRFTQINVINLSHFLFLILQLVLNWSPFFNNYQHHRNNRLPKRQQQIYFWNGFIKFLGIAVLI